MKIFICLLVFLLDFQQTTGIKCFNCSTAFVDGLTNVVQSCLYVNNATRNISCSSSEVCRTTFQLNEGLPTMLKRDCAAKDPSNATNCVVNLNSSYEITKCYTTCNTEYCNNVPLTKVMKCPGNCSRTLNQGYCDYITGKCHCTSGYSSANCQNVDPFKPPVSCIQCNEATDSRCASNDNPPKGLPCPDKTLKYCGSTRTQTLDNDRHVIRSIVTRGCTSSLTHVDECFFSTPSDANLPRYTEFTCTGTCEGNNCNTKTPDGLADKALYCYECCGKDCGTTFGSRKLCPLGSTHCYSRVEYYISDRVDTYEQVDPGYQLIKTERGCATSSMDKICMVENLSDVIEGAKRVVCQESCKEDGCNDGWPTRPRCHQCSKSYDSAYDETSSCILSQSAQSCPLPYHEFCTLEETRIFTSVPFYSNYKLSINRACSYKGIGNACHVTTVDSVSVKLCNRTCSTDGCNIGLFNSASNLQVIHRLVSLLSLVSIFNVMETFLH